MVGRGLVKKNYSIKLSGRAISKLVEKPKIVTNNLLGCGTWIFRPNVFDFIKKTPLNPRTKRKELPDLIQAMIDAGKFFLPFDLNGLYVNVNNQEDLIVAKKLLEKNL